MAWILILIFGILIIFISKTIITIYDKKTTFMSKQLDHEYKIKVLEFDQKKEWEDIRRHIGSLNGMRRGSFWVFSGNASPSTGNPLDIIMDYIRMTFHVDLIKFNRMLSHLTKHLGDVDALIERVGYVETAISIGALRTSLGDEYCVPELGGGDALEVVNAWHPMLAEPVKNTIRAEKGVLLTGSNASGKSTFLKTVAVNAVLAQTIHTCMADSYRAPFYHIYSSMALRDGRL